MAQQQKVNKKALSSSTAKSSSTNFLQTRPFAATNDSTQASPNLQKQSQKTSKIGHSFGQIPVQPKLKIGEPGDKYEQEADNVAAQVVQKINSPTTQRQELGEEEDLQMKPESGTIQREEIPEEEDLQMKPESGAIQRDELPEEEELQMKPQAMQGQSNVDSGTASNEFESSLNSARSGGQSLQPELRMKMESAMGADFGGVKVHTDTQSDQLNQSIQAKAFTTGQDVFFRQGEYNPGSQGGQELIAHELTHVMQQGGAAAHESSIQKKGQNDDDGAVKAGYYDDEDDPVGEVEVDELFGENAEKTTLKSFGKGSELFEESDSSTSTQIDAGKVKTTEKSSQSFAGAGAAIRKLAEADEFTIKQGFQALARAGAFGEASAKKAIETSSGSTASVEGKASGFVGSEGEALGVAVIDAIEGITLLAKLSIKTGAGFNLNGVLEAATEVGGVELKAKLETKLSGFAGVMAEAKGKFNYSATGLALAGKAYAMAGAKSEGEGTGDLNVGEFALNGNGKYEALAGAEAGVEGKIEVGINGIAMSGKAEAFAGAKVKGEAGASLKYQGKVLIKVSGELEAAAGVGGEIEGEFSYKDGKLIIKGKLAATLGLGGGGGIAVEVDFREIKTVILEKVKRAITKKAIDRRSIADQDRKPMDLSSEDETKAIQQLYDAVFPHFKAYGDKKAKGFMKRKAKNLVKREKVQNIIDKKILQNSDLSEKVKYKMSDRVLEKAAIDAFGDQLEPYGIKIQAGIIRVFEVNVKTKDRNFKKLF